MAEDVRAQRLAENEAMYRIVNEEISRAASSLGSDAHLYEFLCECSDAACSKAVRLTHGEYEHVRSEGTRFAVLAGHDDPRIERVVERHEEYVVVEKFGEGAEVARDLDPRSP